MCWQRWWQAEKLCLSSVYKTLEMIPLSALKSLYLTTDNGYTLELKKQLMTVSREVPASCIFFRIMPGNTIGCQWINPFAFLKKLTTDQSHRPSKTLFCWHETGRVGNNPFPVCWTFALSNIGHLRDCLKFKGELKNIWKQLAYLLRLASLQNNWSGFYVVEGWDSLYPYPNLAERKH